jgi:hypothetical protein
MDVGYNCFTLFVYYFGRQLELFYVICILLQMSELFYVFCILLQMSELFYVFCILLQMSELFYVICILLRTSVRIVLRYLYIITDVG